MARGSAVVEDRSYHHGNLRNTLITAAAELIDERGSIDFAMIDAARRAGVSSAAPYRHFKDKDALLEAVCHLAFLGLTQRFQEVADRHDPGASETIVALGDAYIDYMLEHRNFYDLMWGDHGSRAMDSNSDILKQSGFTVLLRATEAWCLREGLSDVSPQQLAIKLWAMVHGLTTLSMNGKIERLCKDADVHSLLQSSTMTFLQGLRQHV